MIILVDADSLIWSSSYKTKEQPEDTGYHTIEDAILKFDQFNSYKTLEKIYEKFNL